MTSLDGGSACCTTLPYNTHNTRKRQTSISLAGFEPAIPARQRPQTLALGRLATGMGFFLKVIGCVKMSTTFKYPLLKPSMIP